MRQKEITRRDDLNKVLGQHLRQYFPVISKALISTIGQEPTDRLEAVSNLVDSFGLPEASYKAVMDYLNQHLG